MVLSRVPGSVAVNAMMAEVMQKRREQLADLTESHQHLNHGAIRNRSLDHTFESMWDIQQMIQTNSILVHHTNTFHYSIIFGSHHLRFQMIQAPQQQRQLPLHLVTLCGKELLRPWVLYHSTLVCQPML
jgi:hypothetical protein